MASVYHSPRFDGGWPRLNCPPIVIFVYPANSGCGLSRRALWSSRRRRQPGIKAALGRSQAVRQRILIPPCGGSNPPAPARQSGLRGFISPLGRIADIPVGYAGRSQSLVGNFPYFGPCGAGFGRRSLVAIFQFPFRRGGDRFDCRQRPVRRGPLESQADAGTKSTASVDSLADIRCVS
jgi:hypothetical protein